MCDVHCKIPCNINQGCQLSFISKRNIKMKKQENMDRQEKNVQENRTKGFSLIKRLKLIMF